MIDYLDPRCRPSTLDSYVNVRLLLDAVRRALDGFSGDVLDVGCGHMPYRSLILSSSTRATGYLGLDLAGSRFSPDLEWDGRSIPLPDRRVDTAVLTEVLEHCPDPGGVLKEVHRVLRPGGLLFLTVPFIWPIHDVPHDEFRYTPFSLQRILEEAGFRGASIEATGGRHAVLATILGLWIRRRPLTSRVHVVTKSVLSVLACPVVWLLLQLDERPQRFDESTMIVGLSVNAFKAE